MARSESDATKQITPGTNKLREAVLIKLKARKQHTTIVVNIQA
ncbi:MAG: hypothetical protein QM737_00135 [Ferruginibacter sp.]